MKKPTDWEKLHDLFVKYRAGDSTAATMVYTILTDVLRAYFMVRLRSELVSEDLTQAALLKIHFARDRFDMNQSLKTWVFTIAHRCLIDHWRGSEATDKTDSISSPGTEEDNDASTIELPSGMDLALRIQIKNDLNLALAHLKPLDRTIVYLRMVENLSIQEIAQTTNLTEMAVKVRVHRCYKQLQNFLKDPIGGSALFLVFWFWRNSL